MTNEDLIKMRLRLKMSQRQFAIAVDTSNMSIVRGERRGPSQLLEYKIENALREGRLDLTKIITDPGE